MVQMTAEELYQNNLAGTGKGETVIHITANGGVAVLNLLKRGYVELYKFDEEYSLGLPDGLVTGELQGEPEIIESEDGTIIKSTYLDGDTLIQVEDHVIPESSGTRHLCTVTRGNDEPVTYQYLSLEGAVFGAYDENGQLCATATTDQNGYLLLGKNESAVHDGLPYGRWTIREISSPDGYRITDPDAEWIVEITEDGMTANRDISGALLYIGNRPDLPAVRVKKRMRAVICSMALSLRSSALQMRKNIKTILIKRRFMSRRSLPGFHLRLRHRLRWTGRFIAESTVTNGLYMKQRTAFSRAGLLKMVTIASSKPKILTASAAVLISNLRSARRK